MTPTISGKRLILLSGKKRSGKDTCARLMKQLDPKVKLLALAGPLKEIVATTFNIPSPQLEEWKDENFVLMHGIPNENQSDTSFEVQSYRNILQRFGSEAMKEFFGQDVWSALATRSIRQQFEYTDTIIITDWRFLSELDYLQDNLKYVKINTLRVHRDGTDLFDSHASEMELDDCNFDYLINNNGTLEELKEKLKAVLNG